MSYTQINEWLTCQHRWRLGYVNLLKRKVMRPSIVLGSIVHQALEVGYGGGTEQDVEIAVDDAIEQQGLVLTEDEYYDVFERALMVTQRGLKTFQPPQYTVATFNGKPAVELHLEVALAGWDSFQCYIDLLVEDNYNGGIWLVDHKVRGAFMPDNAEETNLQMAAYQYVLAHHGVSTAGTISHQIHTEPPTDPVLTKSGAMSRAVVKCDWENYRRCLVENGLDPDDYIEMASKLKGEFVRPSFAYRTPKEVINTWERIIVPVSEEIRYALDHINLQGRELPRVFAHRACSGCLFRELCLEDLRGGDTEFIIATNFEPKQRRWPNAAGN